MGDWKSVLKGLKKDMLGTKGLEQQPNGDGHRRSIFQLKSNHRQSVDKSLTERGARTNSAKLRQPLLTTSGKPHQILNHSTMSQKSPPVQQKQSQVSTNHPLPKKPSGVPCAFQHQSSTCLTRQSSFKLPDAWVSDGIHTQSPHKKQTGDAVDVFIGLDFGTSYTKAAVGMKDQIFVVDWHGVSAGPDRYLLPSEFSILDDGSCRIGQAVDVRFDQVRQRLKQPLIEKGGANDSLANAAVFLALVLQYVRSWIFKYHGDKIGKSSIRWMLNIGAPSNGLENERYRDSYLKLGSAAWSMSLSKTGVGTESALGLIQTWQANSLPKDLMDLSVVPEFVAQIAGYVQSSQRQSGLHALVDVGGGTLDVVTFIVHERDGEDVFPFLVPEIRVLGTQMLNQNRLVEAVEYDESKLPDDLEPVLSTSEYARSTGLPESHLALRDDVFWGEVHNTIRRVFHRTKKNRYQLSDAWTNGMPVFLTGGGGAVDGYLNSVLTGGQQCASSLNIFSLPQHPKLAEFDGSISDYQRVSVACGLAQDTFSFGQLIPAGEVEDEPNATSSPIGRPDRDELYAR